MRIFSWMQNKLTGIHSSKKPDLVSSLSANHAGCVQKEPRKEEFMEWPQVLLAIGTIGNVNFDRTKSTSVITKKSLSFLLKKMIACRNGFAPAPSLKDPISESRMEKIMRATLHKKMKMYPQRSSKAFSSKKYLKSRTVNTPESADEDDFNENAENGSKWVKTDSEYIVLEI